jgi:hypothetical protein
VDLALASAASNPQRKELWKLFLYALLGLLSAIVNKAFGQRSSLHRVALDRLWSYWRLDVYQGLPSSFHRLYYLMYIAVVDGAVWSLESY